MMSKSPPNATTTTEYQEEPPMNQISEGWFWSMTAIAALIVIFGIISNSLVIYFAIKKPTTGALRHINTVVKHLAVSDLLYGALSCPFILTYWRLGKL